MGCNCAVIINNTGRPGCEPVAGVTVGLIVVPLFDSTGALNSITPGTDILNKTFFDGKVNSADPSQRWYPLLGLKNVTSTKADSIFEDFTDGSKNFVREGVRTFTSKLPGTSFTFYGKLKNNRCTQFGVYLVTADGSLIGILDNGVIRPIKVQNASWNPVLHIATDTTGQATDLSFDFDPSEVDDNLEPIYATSMTYNVLLLRGLTDVNLVVTSPSTTGFVAKLATDFGDPYNPIVVKGWVKADFVLKTAAGTTITVTTVTESPAGTYTFVFPTQTTGTHLVLSASKATFDASRFAAVDILVP